MLRWAYKPGVHGEQKHAGMSQQSVEFAWLIYKRTACLVKSDKRKRLRGIQLQPWLYFFRAPEAPLTSGSTTGKMWSAVKVEFNKNKQKYCWRPNFVASEFNVSFCDYSYCLNFLYMTSHCYDIQQCLFWIYCITRPANLHSFCLGVLNNLTTAYTSKNCHSKMHQSFSPQCNKMIYTSALNSPIWTNSTWKPRPLLPISHALSLWSALHYCQGKWRKFWACKCEVQFINVHLTWLTLKKCVNIRHWNILAKNSHKWLCWLSTQKRLNGSTTKCQIKHFINNFNDADHYKLIKYTTFWFPPAVSAAAVDTLKHFGQQQNSEKC